MSQDDQRNQPNEDSAEAARRARAAAARDARDAAATSGAAESAGASTPGDVGAGTASATPSTAGPGATGPGHPAATSSGHEPMQPAATDPGAPDPVHPDITRSATTSSGAPDPVHPDAAATSGGATIATAAGTSASAPESPSARQASSRREFHEAGEGAARYAVSRGEAPRSGSEQSWSAEPNPGYQRDPAIDYPTKRVVAGTLIGALVMAGIVVYGARLLTNRSGNGFGGAAWTAAYARDGAVVGGISAQNNGSAPEIELPAHLTFGTTGSVNSGVFTAAIASCRTATAISLPVTSETGTAAAIGPWSSQAAAAAQKLRADAATLENALNLGHADAVASAANTLCLGYPTIAAVPPMPDAEGSHAWASAVSSFANAATQALQGVSGNPDATAAAFDALSKGDEQLTAMSARIDSVS